MMHIGFDISQVGRAKAGCGYYAHALIQALIRLDKGHRYSLYPSFGDFYFDALMPLRSPYRGKNIHYGKRHASPQTARRFWSQANLEMALDRPDIVHANNFWSPSQLRYSRLIYTLYDMAFAIMPSWTTEANRIGCFRGVFQSALNADWVVAISSASRSHYLETFPHFPENRVRVIYPCSRFETTHREGRCPGSLCHLRKGGFWLSVGTIEPRKNQERLAEAYTAYLSRGGARKPLVFAGGQGWLMDDFEHRLDELGIHGDVIITGYVSDDELIWLYRNCYANLYPSLLEGFGLPVLEGFQFGAPTIASTSTALPEVAGEAAMLLAPDDTDAWCDAMLQLTKNPAQRDSMTERSRTRAKRFAWDTSATQLLELYEEALATPKRRGDQP